MKHYKKILLPLLCFLLLITGGARAQIVVNFSPVVYGQALDGLAYAQIINSSANSLIAKVTIRVRQARMNVVTVITAPFNIRPGANDINKSAYSTGRFAFGNNNYGLTASQTGRFLEGDYEYCYEVDVSASKDPRLPPVFENCFTQQLQPRTPLLLINPVDGDDVCNRRPQFIWQPPLPMPADARFRLILTEVKEKQDIVEAITYNPPVINQANIPGNTLFYPSNAPELKEGQKYAWQVVVYIKSAILSRSEVWTFTLNCPDKKPNITTDSYRELKETDGGDFYIANAWLRFSLNNPYAAGGLSYSIAAMDEPGKPVKGLPALKLAPGLNKFDIDLSDKSDFKSGKEYILIVHLANNRNMRLRFIYKNE